MTGSVDEGRCLEARSRGAILLPLALLHIHVHIHHSFHGPAVGYVGLALGAAASWIGLPGPGEPLLFAAGVLAGQGKLDLASVLLVAFAGASVGGMIGWAIGLKAGRALLTARGPLQALRMRALERGDEVFHRYVPIAILLAPNVMAGIHRVPIGVYILWNEIWAVAWTLVIGLGAYFAGPPILDVISDLGWVGIVGLVSLVAIGVWFELRHRRALRAHRLTERADSREG